MTFMETIDKLKQLPRHGVLPRSGARGRIPAALGRQTSPRQEAPAPREVAPELPAAPIESVNEQVQQLARQLANEIIAERDQMQGIARLGRTFTKFDMVNDVVSKQKETVTAGLWSDVHHKQHHKKDIMLMYLKKLQLQLVPQYNFL